MGYGTASKAPGRSTLQASLRSSRRSLRSLVAVLASSGRGRATGPFRSRPTLLVSRTDRPCPSPDRAGSRTSRSPRAPGRRVVGRRAGSGTRKRAIATRAEPRGPRGRGGETLPAMARGGVGTPRSAGTTTRERSANTATPAWPHQNPQMLTNHHARTLGEYGNGTGLKGATRSTAPGRRKHHSDSPERRAKRAARPEREEHSEPRSIERAGAFGGTLSWLSLSSNSESGGFRNRGAVPSHFPRFPASLYPARPLSRR